MGDEFPAVLRQIKRSKSSKKLGNRNDESKYVLIIGSYTGTGATYNELKTLFETDNIQVILEQEIEQVEVPTYVKSFSIDPLQLTGLQKSLKLLKEVPIDCL